MANNVVYFDTTSNHIQQFNSTDIAKISDYILEYMAANGTFTGSITVGTSNPIGTFTDTYLGGHPYPAANSDNVTVYSTTYTLSQINTATLTAHSDPPMYVGIDTTTTPGTVVLQENVTTLQNLADEIIDRMVGNYGVNSYYLGPASPSDGGLWTNLGTLLDTIYTGSTQGTSYLWKKLNSGTYTSDYKTPLKLSSGQLLQFSDTEIKQIVKIIEQRIVSTGKGLYSMQSSAPVTGTWVDVTEISYIQDNRSTTQELSFLGPTFSSNFINTITYLGPLDGPTFTNTFSAFGPTYLGPSTPAYFGPLFQYVAENAINFSSAIYTGDNVTSFFATYTGDNVNPFGSVTFNNPNGQTFFGNVDAVNYLGANPTFVGPLANYVNYLGPPGTPGINYLGTGPYPFSSSPSLGFYGGPGTGLPPPSYLGPLGYVGSYAGPGNFTHPGYLGPFPFSTIYQGPQTFNSPTTFAGPTNPDGPGFTGTLNYTGDYISTNPDGNTFSAAFAYTGDFTGDYIGTRVASPTQQIGSAVRLWKRIA